MTPDGPRIRWRTWNFNRSTTTSHGFIAIQTRSPRSPCPTPVLFRLATQAGAGISPTCSPTLTRALQGNGALPILSLLFRLTAQRTVTENWSLTPITDADNLRRLRCAYRLLVMGEETANYEFCDKQMKEFFAGESAALADYFPLRHWYSVGYQKDIPKDACYVGSHDCMYVWVTPEGMNGLALFTIGALDLATGKLPTPQQTVVSTYKGEPKPENLLETTVTRTEDDEATLEEIPKGRTSPQSRPRVADSPGFNPGLLLQPRP